MTTTRVCNYKESTLQREIPLENLQGLTKCTEDTNNEFVMHIKNEHDYRYHCDTRQHRNECITAVKECYWHKTGGDIPIFGIQSSQTKMGSFVQTKRDLERNNRSMPGEHFRLFQEDTCSKNAANVTAGLMR